MKWFYSGLEVAKIQQDAEYEKRAASLNFTAVRQTYELKCATDIQQLKNTLAAQAIESGKQNALDKANAIVDIRQEYIKDIAELTEKLAVATAEKTAYEQTIVNAKEVIADLKKDKDALLATVTGLAQKPVIVKETTTTATATAGAANVYMVKDGQPVQIVK
jgi:hypothetical protein